jgi:hypothetical protein
MAELFAFGAPASKYMVVGGAALPVRDVAGVDIIR